jgi:hypothetical protein
MPYVGPPYHTGAPVSVFVHVSPKLFIIYCKMPLFPGISLILFFVTFDELLSSFWPNATHVTLGWSITHHLPWQALSTYLEYPTGHLPLPSTVVHFVPPLAQLLIGLVVPLTLDLVTRLRPLFISYILQPRAVLCLPTS